MADPAVSRFFRLAKRNAHSGSVKGLFRCNLNFCVQILAGLRTCGTGSASHVREQISKIKSASAKVKAFKTVRSAAETAPSGRRFKAASFSALTELVISGFLFRIGQSLIGLVHILELGFSILFFGDIRVIFMCQFPEGLLDIGFRC